MTEALVARVPIHARIEAVGVFEPTPTAGASTRGSSSLEPDRHEDVVDVAVVEEELLPLDALDHEAG